MNLSICFCADPSNTIKGGGAESLKLLISLNHPHCVLADTEMMEQVHRALTKTNQPVSDQFLDETWFESISRRNPQSLPMRLFAYDSKTYCPDYGAITCPRVPGAKI